MRRGLVCSGVLLQALRRPRKALWSTHSRGVWRYCGLWSVVDFPLTVQTVIVKPLYAKAALEMSSRGGRTGEHGDC